jgi:excisionase family DNA binding protein
VDEYPDSIKAWFKQIARQAVEEVLREQAAQGEREYLTTQEAAQLARVVPGTIRRWIREGRLPGANAGREVRVRRADLDRLMTCSAPGTLSPEALAQRDLRALHERTEARRSDAHPGPGITGRGRRRSRLT